MLLTNSWYLRRITEIKINQRFIGEQIKFLILVFFIQIKIQVVKTKQQEGSVIRFRNISEISPEDFSLFPWTVPNPVQVAVGLQVLNVSCREDGHQQHG